MGPRLGGEAGAYFLDIMTIWGLSGPDGTRERVADGFPGGHWWLHYRDGVLNVIVQGTRAEPVPPATPGAAPKVEAVPRTEWWQLDPTAGKWSRVATDAPRVDSLHVTSHHGYVIAAGANGETHPPGLSAVEFVPPKM